MLKWLMGIIIASGYTGLAILMFLENLIPPIPSEFIMPLAGYMSAEGKFRLPVVILVGTFGSVMGTLPLYFWGQRITEERLHEIAHRHGRWLTITHRDIRRSIRWFHSYGGKAVFFGRLVPGVRAIISIPAGMFKMRLHHFLFFTILSSLIWNSLLACAGFYLESRFTIMHKYLESILIGVIIAIIVIYFTRVIRHKKENI